MPNQTPHSPNEPLLAVAFDLDGLMFNTEDLYEYVGTVVLQRRGKVFNDDLLHKMIGLRTPIALQVMIDYHSLDDTAEELAAESDAVFQEILPTRLAPMHGLLEFLDVLEAATIKKCVATSSPREFAHRVLGQFNLVNRFEFILGAEDVHDGKPEPEIYLTAAKQMNVPTGQMLVLEDSEVGSKAGVAAGAYTVAVPHGHTAHQNFGHVQFIATSLADVRIRQVLGLS